MLTLDKIYHAAYVLKSVARKTDLIAAPGLNAESEIYLKTENLQVTGSFKVRGAYYKISQLRAVRWRLSAAISQALSACRMARPSARWKRLKHTVHRSVLLKAPMTTRMITPASFRKRKGILSSTRSMTRRSLRGRVLSAWKFWISCPTWRSYWFRWAAAASSSAWLTP